MKGNQKIIKNIIFCCSLNLSILFSQFSYPAEDFLGGGIGYSPMYITLDSLPGASYLTNLGLNPNNFDDPLVIHGGEGFAHVTGRWRIGGYAGMGRTSTSTIPEVMIFIDADSSGTWEEGETVKAYDDFVNPSISANFTFLLGAASVEYVMPLLQDLELSAGALMGLGRAGMAINQTSSNPKWSQVFSNVYGTLDSTTGALYYGVSAEDYDNPDIRPGPVPGLLRDVSSAFFNFQPYVAVKWQFLERLGLRISVGFNKGTVSAGSWKLNGKTAIADSPTSALAGAAFRTMIYVGL